MSGKVKLDRADWGKIQFGAGAPSGSTPGNVYINSSTGDLYLRRVPSVSWAVVSGGGSDVSDWATTTTYRIRQEVLYVGLRFRCSSAHTSSGSFFTDLNRWECVSNEGTIVNQNAHGFSTQDVIYQASGTWAKADASDGSKLSDPPTLVAGSNTNYFLMVQDGTVTVTGHGLTVDQVYFLDASTPGLLTLTEPVTVGLYSNPILKVRDTNTLTVVPYRPAEAALAGGADTYLSLSDTVSSFTASAIPYTNTGATALEDSTNFLFAPDATGGALKIGIDASTDMTYSAIHGLAIENTGIVASPILSMTNFSNSTASPEIRLTHSRGTASVSAAVNSSDNLGALAFYGTSAVATFGIGATIRALTSEAWSAGSNGTTLELLANVNSSTSLSSATGVKINLPSSGDVSVVSSTSGSIKLNAGGNILGQFYGSGQVDITSFSSQDVTITSVSDIINDFSDSFIARHSGSSKITLTSSLSDLSNTTVSLSAVSDINLDYNEGDGSNSLSIRRGSGNTDLLVCSSTGLVTWSQNADFVINFSSDANVLDVDSAIKLADTSATGEGLLHYNANKDSDDHDYLEVYNSYGWRQVWDYDYEDNASAGWQDVPTFTRSANDTFSVDISDLHTDVFKKGRPIRYRATAGTWRYGIVTNYAAGTVTLAGAPMTVSDDDQLQFGDMSRVVEQTFVVSGTFATGVVTTVLKTEAGIQYSRSQGEAYVVRFTAIAGTADTGPNDPRMNVVVGSGAVSTSNSNAGLEIAAADTLYTTTTDINVSNYGADFGDTIEVSCDGNGSGDDAEDLTIVITSVLA